jgi:radical SAM superfamily enzyme YgiQ (UPF0313 family)
MRILFVLPYEKLSGIFYTEPLGIMYLASIANCEGHQCLAALANWEELSDALVSFAPDVLAFSATTGAHNAYLKLARQAKAIYPHIFTIFGGPHPTYFPEMINEAGVDAICRGEGEEAFAEFLYCLQEGKDFTQVHNLWVKLDGKVYQNPVRPAITDLDTIPFPDRNLTSQLYAHSTRYIITTRGCPFDCTYCFNHAFRKLYADVPGKTVRYRTVDNVIEELRSIIHDDPTVQRFFFVDDIFNVNKNWLKEFCVKYRGEIGLPFSCLCRVDLMTQEMAQDLADAGCVLVSVGIEAGNDRIRQEVMKRNMSKETIINGCQMIHDAGIKLKTFNILGIPPGNFEDDLETLDLNIRCRPDYPTAFLLTPFPMTELGEKTRNDGYWYDDRYNSFFETFSWGQLSEKSRLRLQDRAEIEILQMLFIPAVKWPILAGSVKFLCRSARRFRMVEMGLKGARGWRYAPVLSFFGRYFDWHLW